MTSRRLPVRGRRRVAVLALTLLGAVTGSCLAASPVGAAPVATGGLPGATRVVVTSAGGSSDGAAAAVVAAGGRVLDRLTLVGGVAAELPAGAVLASSWWVVADRALQVAGKVPEPGLATGPGPRATLGLGAPAGEGLGTTVAIVDTGIADVAGLPRVSHVDVSGAGPGDGYGHGTFVAGLVAGAGGDGVPAGIAPGAALLDVRVARDDGSTDLITVLRGLQVVAAHPEVDVLNLSLSSGSPLPYQLDPLTVALEVLWQRGVTVVVPAGNEGSARGTVTSPGSDPVLLTVGGLDEHGSAERSGDTVATWSGRGPAPQGVAKPDLVAPGTSLVSLRAPGSVIDRAHPASRVGSAGFRGSGTSFSTAVASGAAATLLGRRPLRPDQVKALLTATAYDDHALGSRSDSGAGGLDLAAALTARAPAPDRAARQNASQVGDVPGDPQAWADLMDAIMDGGPQAAVDSWARLSPASRAWATRAWADLDRDVRDAGTSAWVERSWPGASPEQWASRDWAARLWASRNWASRNWASRNWSGQDWASRNWSSRNWSSRNWSSDDWASRNWSSRNWSGADWAGADWASRNWSSRNWSARTWSALDAP